MDKYFQPALIFAALFLWLVLHNYDKIRRWGKKGPTEVICYPEKWHLIVYTRVGEIRRCHTMHSGVKKKFTALLEWFDKHQTGVFHLKHDCGEMIFDREHISMIEFDVTKSNAGDFK